jgi:hypothetical protein
MLSIVTFEDSDICGQCGIFQIFWIIIIIIIINDKFRLFLSEDGLRANLRNVLLLECFILIMQWQNPVVLL